MQSQCQKLKLNSSKISVTAQAGTCNLANLGWSVKPRGRVNGTQSGLARRLKQQLELVILAGSRRIGHCSWLDLTMQSRSSYAPVCVAYL